MSETDEIRHRYSRRKKLDPTLYSPLLPAVMMMSQEKMRAFIRWVNFAKLVPLSEKKLLEIGCGSGADLLFLILLGFRPDNLTGIDLLEDRAYEARKRLPAATNIIIGDALEATLPEEYYDVVTASTVFSSILDDSFQQKLAARMWSLLKAGGGVLLYDFVYNNPRNQDVRGVPHRRIKELFPYGIIHSWRLTLAPPISRCVAKVHPIFYTLFNLMPFLRTHMLSWICK
jgi:SAM-dependent methyltransferase